MRKTIFVFALLVVSLTAHSQPRYDMEGMSREKLNRGVVAVKDADGQVIVSWRTLYSDATGEGFDVYRNGVKLNVNLLTSGGTFFVDSSPLATDATYEVRGGGINGSYTVKADAPVGYIPIKIEKPADGINPDGRSYTYSANDASVGDVDGDGQYEIILKWLPSDAADNSRDGFTGPTLLDCYTLEGERLWRIDLGKNIRSGAHYVQFIVYDLDGDGKAEVMVKTADGTVDGVGNVIGDSTADYRRGLETAAANYEKNRENDGKERAFQGNMRDNMRDSIGDWRMGPPPPGGPGGRGGRGPGRRDENVERGYGRVLSGPEYLTVFNGLTGEAMATVDYVPERGELSAWGDDNGNRSERYLAGVGYFDGKHASAIFCRGYYTRSVIAAWDWDGKSLTNRWTFDTNDEQWADYACQGNHNIRIGDVDGDGCDEITYGSCAIDHDGTGLYNTGMGHGDAIHQTVFDPTSDKLQVWDCHENRKDGSDFRDAATGKVIFQVPSTDDVGRCMAADIDPTNPGLEMWSSASGGVRTIKGDILDPLRDADQSTKDEIAGDPATLQLDNTALYVSGKRLPTNFAVWWDGDLLREMLDHNTVSKYDWTTGRVNDIMTFDGCTFNNGSKSNPCLSGDIIGDWREEVLVRTMDESELRLYISTIPTEYRINTLMEDIPYRISIATENVAYNQPPETGFYLGPDETVVPFLK